MRFVILFLVAALLCIAVQNVAAEPSAQKSDSQPIARVLGNSICLEDLQIVEGDKTALRYYFAIAGEVLPLLVAKYIKDRNLDATDVEIAEFEAFMTANEPKTPSKRKKPPKPLKPNHEIARQFVEYWKFHKALHDKYGGRVVFQQAGIEPLDAYVKWLADEEKAGNFEILDPKWKEAFAEYYKPKYHRFPDVETQHPFSEPFWRAKKELEEKSNAPE